MIGRGSKDDVETIEAAAITWGRSFLACGSAGLRGFAPSNITPYVHVVICHAPAMVGQIGDVTLEDCNGEALEHLNSDVKISKFINIIG